MAERALEPLSASSLLRPGQQIDGASRCGAAFELYGSTPVAILDHILQKIAFHSNGRQGTGGRWSHANLQAIQYMLLGYQHDTVYKPFNLQAAKAAELAVQLIKYGTIDQSMIDGHVDNGFMTPGVPAVFLPVQLLTVDSVDAVVRDGVWSWAQICTGPAAVTEPA